MSDSKQAKSNHTIGLVMSVYLIFGALNAVFVRAGEYGSGTLIWMKLLIDVGMIGLLVVFLVKAAQPDDTGGLRTAFRVLGVIGVIAGLIKLGARFSGSHGWWTGHYMAPVFN